MRNKGLGKWKALGLKALLRLGSGKMGGDQAASRREVGCSTPSPALAQTVQGCGRGAETSLIRPLAPPWGSSSPNPHRTPFGAHFNYLMG